MDFKTIYSQCVRLLRCILALLRSVKDLRGSAGIAKRKHSHIRTHTHTNIQTYTHIHTYRHSHAHTHTRTQAHTHTHTRTQSPTTTNTLTRAHSHIVCCISDVSPVVAYPYIPRHASVRNVRGAPVVAKRLESGAPPRRAWLKRRV